MKFPKVLTLLCLLALLSCKKGEEYFTKASDVTPIVNEPIETIDEPVDPIDLCEGQSGEQVVCNPFGGDKVLHGHGLIAVLIEGDSSFQHIDKYIAEGIRHPEILYFSNFNVPTRAFDQGFNNGIDFLLNLNGEKLMEWFAVEAKGNIGLPKNIPEGSYHIVTISDDGIRVKVGGEVILNNPSVHAPRIDCASKLIELESGKRKSFELQYFQGPRYHIALMTFIKKIDPSAPTTSQLCNTSHGPAALIAEGYEVISPEWFTRPAGQ